MTPTKPPYKPRRFRIYRRVTAGTILTVEDALDPAEKILFTATAYKNGKGASASVAHYLDHQTAALLAHDLLHIPPPAPAGSLWWNGWTDFKGTKKGDALQARTFTIEHATGTKKPIRISITNGPGEAIGNTGAVKPKKGADQTRVAVLLDFDEVRTMALALLMHLQAWCTMTLYQRRQAATYQPPSDDPPPLLVDPKTGEIVG